MFHRVLMFILMVGLTAATVHSANLGGVAVDSGGAVLTTDTVFTGGVGVGGDPPVGNTVTFHHTENMTIAGVINVGAADVGSTADILILAVYTPPGGPALGFMRGTDGSWTLVEQTLPVYRQDVTLSATENVDILAGVPQGLYGTLDIYLGYQLAGGSLVFNPVPIHASISGGTGAPFESGCLDIDDSGTRVTEGRLAYTDSIFNCVNGAVVDDGDELDAVTQQVVSGGGNMTIDPQLDANLAARNPAALLPQATGASFDAIAAVSALPIQTGKSAFGIWQNGFFERTDYIGAVDPRARHAWWDGWTIQEGSGSLKNETFHPLRAEIEGGMIAPSAAPCPAGVLAGVQANIFGTNFPICVINQAITDDVTLSNGHVYLVDGTINVGNGGAQGATDSSASHVTLTVEAGVQIFGDTTADTSGIVITRGSDIVIAGTATMPVVMSSADGGQISTSVNNFSGRDEWGGLIVDGFAPVNEGGEVLSEAAPEGVNRYFGGNDPLDGSGSIRYLVVAESGQEFRLDEEIQGLTLEGVGAGTEIDYVQIHQSGDDGIEWFGGTVNASHLVITGPEDDGLDMDLGFQGGIQYAIVKMANDGGDRAIESDNNGDNYDITPISNPTMSNITLIGDVGAPDASTRGAVHREGFGVFMHKAIITDGDGPFESGCLDIDDSGTRVTEGRLAYTDSIFNCVNGAVVDDGDELDAVTQQVVSGGGNMTIDPQLDANLAARNPAALLPQATGASFDAIAAVSALPIQTGKSAFGIWQNGFFERTDYIGAVDPRARHAWWDGWTIQEGSGSLKNETFHPLRAEIEGGMIAPSAAPCPAGVLAGVQANIFGTNFPICVINQAITDDVTLSNGHVYLVDGTINVGNGGAQGATDSSASHVTLTVEAGVQIFGDTTADTSGIVITRGSDIVIAGTATMPVVMSSADGGQISTSVNNFSGRDEWGGLIVDGFAPVNEGGEVLSEAAPEGVNRYFGGNDPLDGSGSIRYLVVAESGQEFRLDEEIQGLTLEGVGAGTEIDYVQIHQSGDDGIEWFGGTVNASHLVITGPEDDGLDMDLGFQGGIQYAIVKMANDGGDRAIESDNNGDNYDITPISNPTMSNITLIGDVGAPDASTRGAVHREGFGVFMHKAIITDGGN